MASEPRRVVCQAAGFMICQTRKAMVDSDGLHIGLLDPMQIPRAAASYPSNLRNS